MGFKKLFKSTELWVIAVFLLVLGVRLFIAFQSPFYNYEAYYPLRQAQSIIDSGLPLYNDPLSYGGKTQLFAPLYYYILALFGIVMPLELVAKILPNLFAAGLVIITYMIALRITKSQKISLFTAFMTGFIPVMYIGINSASIDYLTLLLVFGTIYCMFRIQERRYIDYMLILIFLLVLTSPIALILILGMSFYLILLKLENHQIEMKELEIILFFSFLAFWVNLLIYKSAFQEHGILAIWQNIPIQLLSTYFDTLNFTEAFISISIIPLILGLYAFYIALYQEKNKEVLLIIGLTIASFLLMWFRLVNFVASLMFLSLTLVILSSYSLKRLNEIFEKTKAYKYTKLVASIVIAIFALTSIWPSYIIGMERSEQVPSPDTIKVLMWTSENTLRSSIVASTLEEGNLVAYYSQRKNVIDDNFLLTPKIDQRVKDIDTLYTTKFEVQAVGTLNRYNAKYLLFSDYAKEKYGTNKLEYTSNDKCFEEAFYSQNTTLYLSKCKVR